MERRLAPRGRAPSAGCALGIRKATALGHHLPRARASTTLGSEMVVVRQSFRSPPFIVRYHRYCGVRATQNPRQPRREGRPPPPPASDIFGSGAQAIHVPWGWSTVCAAARAAKHVRPQLNQQTGGGVNFSPPLYSFAPFGHIFYSARPPCGTCKGV